MECFQKLDASGFKVLPRFYGGSSARNAKLAIKLLFKTIDTFSQFHLITFVQLLINHHLLNVL